MNTIRYLIDWSAPDGDGGLADVDLPELPPGDAGRRAAAAALEQRLRVRDITVHTIEVEDR